MLHHIATSATARRAILNWKQSSETRAGGWHKVVEIKGAKLEYARLNQVLSRITQRMDDLSAEGLFRRDKTGTAS
jgi:hypothetical protein